MKNMLFLISAIVLCTSSCNSDNDDSPTNLSELLAGEWRYVSQSLNGTLIDFEDDCRGESGMDFQVFRSDKSYQEMDFELIEGTACTVDEENSLGGTWAISESTLTISPNSGNPYDAEILVLNQNILQYSLQLDYDEDNELDSLVLIFEKQ